MASFSNADLPRVGSRVLIEQQDGKASGTVRYAGKTAFKGGDWVGVELDASSNVQGKNDGTVEGRSYFTCNRPNSGLFVRPQAVSLFGNGSKLVDERLSRKDEDTTVQLEHKDMDVDEDGDSSSLTFWFDIQARAFLFVKGSKEWHELALATAQFHWDSHAGRVLLNMRSGGDSGEWCLDHLVDPSTKIDPNVVAQQSWVFRAQRRSDTACKDVLCLQFATVALANRFCSSFESFRGEIGAVGAASNKQRRKVRDTDGAPPERKTRVMRRRLTVSGSDPRLDGHELGAGNEVGSPRPTSPKALRSGQVGQWGLPVNSAAASGPKIQVAAYSGVSRKGVAPYNPDKQNQDSMIMAQLPLTGYSNGELLLACFDGHGSEGHLVSRHIAARLPKLLCKSPHFAKDEHTGDVLAECLLELENELMQDRTVDTTLSGTTAVVSVLRDNKLFVANVGDSRIIKGTAEDDRSSRVVAQDLSIDHKPDDERETKRITAMGGRVFAMKYDDGIDGPARVWLSYADMPGLAMSRSLCDTIAKEAGVISNAELHMHQLEAGKDKFIVLATDGLWEFMSSQEVADIVSKHMADADPRSAISELVRESNRRWQLEEPVIDDTTIVIAYLTA